MPSARPAATILGLRRDGIFFLLAALLFLAAPGSDRLPANGLPLGALELCVLVGLVIAAYASFGVSPGARATRPLAFALVGLAVLKAGLSLLALPHGWTGAYFPNATLSGSPEWSAQFRLASATRMDQYLDFQDLDEQYTTFPVHFFNDVAQFNEGTQRQFTNPYSVRWTGYLQLDSPLQAEVRARGGVQVAVDGTPVLDHAAGAAGDWSAPLTIGGPGAHQVSVTYVKPATTHGLFALTAGQQPLGGARVFQAPPDAGVIARDQVAWIGILLLEILAAGLVLACVALSLAPLLSRARRHAWSLASVPDRCWLLLASLVLVVQGVIRAAPLAGRFMTLTGGDDWLAYEGLARTILSSGVLMTGGAPLGQVRPYFYSPGYSYVLAAEHLLTGDDLFGPLLGNFLSLVGMNLALFLLARKVFGRAAALLLLPGLLVLEELAFIPHYTTNLLSEDFFVLPLSLALLALVNSGRHGRWHDVALAGVWTAVAIWTRPPFELFAPVALAYLGWTRWRASHRVWGVLVSGGLFTGVTAAIVLLATLRNYIVSGKVVLNVLGSEIAIITANLAFVPDPQHYVDLFNQLAGQPFQTFRVILALAHDYPLQLLLALGQKAAFTFGATNLLGDGISLHPEFVGISLCWVVASLLLLRTGRQQRATVLLLEGYVLLYALPIVVFSPLSYGYRLLLPMYPVMLLIAAGGLVPELSRVRWIGNRLGNPQQANERIALTTSS